MIAAMPLIACIHIIIFIYNKTFTQGQLIKIPLLRHYNSFDIRAVIGNSNKNLTIPIHLTNNITIILPFHHSNSNDKFIFSNSSAIIDSNITLYEAKNNIYHQGKELVDSFTLYTEDNRMILLKNYSFYYFDDSSENKGLYNALSLNYHSYNNIDDSDIKYSLIHLLKDKGIISSNSFSMINTYDYQKYLYLGGYPLNKSLQESFGYCDIIGYKNRWDCSISSIILYFDKNNEDNIKTNNVIYYSKGDYAYFDIVHSYIIFCTKEFNEYIIKHYFTIGVERKQCIIELFKERKMVSCHNDYVHQLGNITFVIGQFEYVFDMIDFWTCLDEYCDFDIIENPNDKNEWILGGMFFERFNMMLHYDERKIYFYSNDPLKISKHMRKDEECDLLIFRIKLMISIDLLIMIHGILFIIVIYINHIIKKKFF